ncbi:MAG: hypothetical protein QXM68_02175 [Candidatus Aenigmatarchaeota archaeon]|nr:hypothetical protein [Candidatus Aenigmarchaeota archaeon]
MKFKFLIYLLLPLIISSAYAKDYDSTSSIYPREIIVSQCGIATFDITLTNAGEKEDTFYTLVEGIPEGWYDLSHDYIELQPKQAKTVYLFITANCFEQPKNYTGKISFLGNSETFSEFKMNVVSDHSLELLSRPKPSCLCEETETTFILRNTGKYDEKVKLYAKGGYLEQDVFDVKSGQEIEFKVRLDKACDFDEKDYIIEISAESLSSYAKVKSNFPIQRDKCYDFKIEYNNESSICINEKATFSVTLHNTGTKDDEYILSMDALDILEKINVSANQTKTFNLVFEPDEVGIIDLGFSVKSNTKEEKGTIRFNVEKCYGVDLIANETQINILLGEGKLVKAKLVNTGTRDDTFKIVSDVKWVSLRPEQVLIKGMKTEDIFIYYSPEYNQIGEFQTSIKAYSNNSFDEEKINVKVSSEPVAVQPEDTTQVTTTTEIKESQTNKTLIALIVGLLLTFVIFGLIYMFVMRD